MKLKVSAFITVGIAAIVTFVPAVEAASWGKTNAGTNPCWNSQARAGYYNFMKKAQGDCYVNWTTTSYDVNLNDDTYTNGTNIFLTTTYWSQNITPGQVLKVCTSGSYGGSCANVTTSLSSTTQRQSYKTGA